MSPSPGTATSHYHRPLMFVDHRWQADRPSPSCQSGPGRPTDPGLFGASPIVTRDLQPILGGDVPSTCWCCSMSALYPAVMCSAVSGASPHSLHLGSGLVWWTFMTVINWDKNKLHGNFHSEHDDLHEHQVFKAWDERVSDMLLHLSFSILHEPLPELDGAWTVMLNWSPQNSPQTLDWVQIR